VSSDNDIHLFDVDGQDPPPNHFMETLIIVSTAPVKRSGDDDESKQLQFIADNVLVTPYRGRTSSDSGACALQCKVELRDLSPDTISKGWYSLKR
jgi:hypothetical protein